MGRFADFEAKLPTKMSPYERLHSGFIFCMPGNQEKYVRDIQKCPTRNLYEKEKDILEVPEKPFLLIMASLRRMQTFEPS